MALSTGLRRPRRLAGLVGLVGLVGLSGQLSLAARTAAEHCPAHAAGIPLRTATPERAGRRA